MLVYYYCYWRTELSVFLRLPVDEALPDCGLRFLILVLP